MRLLLTPVLLAGTILAQDDAASELQDSIDRGVERLVALQRDDGSWTDGPKSAHDTATTAFAVLALLADGNTTTRGPRAAAVQRAVDWLREQLDDDGRVIGRGSVRCELDQAVVTFALSEAGGLSKDDAILESAGRAAGALGRMREPEGGWETEFAPGETDTTLVTALVRLVGVSLQSYGVPADRIDPDEIARWMGIGSAPAGWPATATPRAPHSARLLVAQLGGETDVAPLEIDLDAVVGDAGPERDDPLARYVAIFAAFQHGGRLWKRIRAPLFDLVDAQRDDGTWPASKRWQQDGGGDVSSTALTVLSLRTFHRFTRLVR